MFLSIIWFLKFITIREFSPLSKIASGGEVSRIMLSIKSVLKEDDPVQTLIFDEIDSASEVGQFTQDEVQQETVEEEEV